MTLQKIIAVLEAWAPQAYAEDFDNVGLLTGDPNWDCTGILITLDTLEVVIDEAIAKKCNCIVSFHPIIFSGLKKFTGRTYVERTVTKAIENRIAIYAMHTALDNHSQGVNFQIGKQLGLSHTQLLIPKKNTLQKLTTYVPSENAKALLAALHDAGAGAIGKYEQCSFSVLGKGTFKGNSDSTPTIGMPLQKETVEEQQLHVIFPKHLESKILKTLFAVHPYEEVAYEITALENKRQDVGMGAIGKLPQPMEEKDFLAFVKKNMNTSTIRHSPLMGRKIESVAVLGVSGSFAIDAALAQGADAFITADLKYHQFFQAENKILLADIGHFESEQFTKNLMYEYLIEKLPNFAIALTETDTNPVNYF